MKYWLKIAVLASSNNTLSLRVSTCCKKAIYQNFTKYSTITNVPTAELGSITTSAAMRPLSARSRLSLRHSLAIILKLLSASLISLERLRQKILAARTSALMLILLE